MTAVSTTSLHKEFKSLLAQRRADAATELWLQFIEQNPDDTDLALLLIKDMHDAGFAAEAAELASLLAPTLREKNKFHEWLWLLKLQANTKPAEKSLRPQLIEAYTRAHSPDARLKILMDKSGLADEHTPLPLAIQKLDTLLALSENAFCAHKSWGYGRVKQTDLTLGRITVAFLHNPDHAMQLDYAAESLTPIPPDHIEARKMTDLDGLKKLADTDPLALLRIVLGSFGRAATLDTIETALVPAVIAPENWKKWWQTCKKRAKKDPHFDIPAKKTDPISLRDAPLSVQDKLIEQLHRAKTLHDRLQTAKNFLNLRDSLANAELLAQEFIDALAPAANDLETALVLDEMRPPADRAALKLLAATKNLPETLEKLTPWARKRALSILRQQQKPILLELINRFSAKILDEIADFLPETAPKIAQLIQNQAASAELLLWICKNRNEPWLADLINTKLFHAVAEKMEASSTKLRNLLVEDKTLLLDLLADAHADDVRDAARAILQSVALEEINRRSLMGRLVKHYPFVQELLTSREEKPEALWVSWKSLERRKAELDEIIQKKIPQISREIAQARSYGDLRENFEYKAAKHQQRLLLRRRAELEAMINRATPTDFSDVATDSVRVGTLVTLRDIASNKTETYAICGAWDSDPDRGIISYEAALAQSLMGKKIGDEIELADDDSKRRARIERIEKLPRDLVESL